MKSTAYRTLEKFIYDISTSSKRRRKLYLLVCVVILLHRSLGLLQVLPGLVTKPEVSVWPKSFNIRTTVSFAGPLNLFHKLD